MLSSYCIKSLFIIGVLSAAPVVAQEIYKWVDEEGSTHYSESPPEAEISSLEILEVVNRPVVEKGTANYRTTLDVANSMQQGRLERERLRLEKLKLEQLKLQSQRDAMRYEEASRSTGYFWPYYGYGRHRPPYGKPPGYHRPPPGHRPPHGPPPGPYPGGNVPKRVHINR